MTAPVERFSGRLTRRGRAAVACSAGMLLLVGSPALAVSGGTPDGGAHPYVVGIVAAGHSAMSCTGVLVQRDSTRSVVVTAAHCLYGQGARSGRATVVFTSGAGSANWSIPANYDLDPAYAPRLNLLHDVAVLTLSTSPPVAGARLAPIGTLDRSRAASFVTVGYGDPHRGQRWSASEDRVRTTQDWLYLRQGTGNSCSGDSGGPDLMPGGGPVVALTDQGSCTDSQDVRLDTAPAQDFINRIAGVQASLSRSSVPAGRSTVLSAVLQSRAAGRVILRQGFYSGTWHTWATGVVHSDGTAAFTITPTHRTTDHYRLLLTATHDAPAQMSPTRDLVVTLARIHRSA